MRFDASSIQNQSDRSPRRFARARSGPRHNVPRRNTPYPSSNAGSSRWPPGGLLHGSGRSASGRASVASGVRARWPCSTAGGFRPGRTSGCRSMTEQQRRAHATMGTTAAVTAQKNRGLPMDIALSRPSHGRPESGFDARAARVGADDVDPFTSFSDGLDGLSGPPGRSGVLRRR